jgi:hypothetical protein
MRPIELTVTVDHPAERVWAGLVDWPTHAAWMPLTTVQVVGGGPGQGLGERIVATTGIGPLGVADRMTITEWSPPRRLAVDHTGRLIRGTAWFELQPIGADRTRIVWCEALVPPFGALGRVFSPFLSIGTRAVIGLALRRYRRTLDRAASRG